MLKKAAGQKVLEEQSAFLHCLDKQNAKIYEEYSWFTKLFRKWEGSLAQFPSASDMRQHCRKPTYWNSLESQPLKIYKSGKKRTDRTKTHINRTFTVTQNRFWFYIFSNVVSHNTKLRDIAVWASWKQGRNRMFLRLIFVFSEKFIEKPPANFYGKRRYLSKIPQNGEQKRWFFVIATMLPPH